MAKIKIAIKIIDLHTGEVTYERECKSWDIQLLQLLYLGMAFIGGAGSLQVKDTGGTSRTLNATGMVTSNPFTNICAVTGNDDFGICVGTSDNAESALDYKAVNQILHGTGASTLVYGDTGITTAYEFPNGGQFEIHRSFYNVSGGDIAIKEVCLIGFYNYGGNIWYFCLTRDVVDENFADGAYKQIRFTVSVDN